MGALAPILQEYFTAYLMTQRAMSGATIRTYRDTWKLFLGFLSRTVHVPVHQLQTTDIDASRVLNFLEHLETGRGNTVATRNLRLAAIKSLMGFYATKASPEQLHIVAQRRRKHQARQRHLQQQTRQLALKLGLHKPQLGDTPPQQDRQRNRHHLQRHARKAHPSPS